MKSVDMIVKFLRRVKFGEYREDCWGFMSELGSNEALIVVTDPKTMRREFQYHLEEKFLIFKRKKVIVVDRDDCDTVDWYHLNDVLYDATNRVKVL